MATISLPPQLRRTRAPDRWVAGVAGGVARALGIDPLVVRVAFGLLSFAGGTGVFLYGLAWALVPEGDVPGTRRRPDRRTLEQAVGVGMVTVGLLLVLRRLGFFFPDEFVWPAALVVTGAAVAWSKLDGRGADLLDGGKGVVVRLVAGAVLLSVGIGSFVAHDERFVVITQVLVAVVAATVGAALLAGPWILGLARQLADERRQRIRADERAEVAAHLHDSVLQTLALIQRRAASPSDTVALARRQERELREWLHGRRREVDEDTVAISLRAVADEVEADHAVAVDVVVVGDARTTPATAALVGAVREAVVNAAKHAGVDTVSVYGEVGEAEVTAFVRDRGRGFDVDAVPADRQGIGESIVGRLSRHGGRAEITSGQGEGTEVVLTLPLRSGVRP